MLPLRRSAGSVTVEEEIVDFCMAVSFFLAASAGPVDVEAIESAILAHRMGAQGVRFTIRVEARIWPPPKTIGAADGAASDDVQTVKSIDRFSMLAPSGASARPWRKWERFSLDGVTLEEYYVTNGLSTWSWSRRKPGDLRAFNFGAIVAWEDSDLFRNNYYDEFLSKDLKGLVEYFDPTGEVSKSIKIEWGGLEAAGFGDLPALSLKAFNPSMKVNHSLLILEPPRTCVVLRELRLLGSPEPIGTWTVSEVKDLDGWTYPSRGSLRISPIEYQAQLAYDFEVVVAAKISEDERVNWVPEWPSGTIVRDVSENQNFTVPFAAGQKEAISKEIAQVTLGAGAVQGRSPRQFFWIANAVIVVLLVGVWWRSRRKCR